MVLATGGSLGDLHPFVALGLALRELGVVAEIAASDYYRSQVEAEGLPFHPVGPSLDRLRSDLGLTLKQITERVAASDAFLFERILLPYLEETTRDLLRVADGTACIVGSTLSLGAELAAERLGVPFVSIALQPAVLMSAYDPPVLPQAPWLRSAQRGSRLWLNRVTLGIGRRTTARWTAPINRVREAVGLPIGAINPLFDAGRRAALALGLYSPLLGAATEDSPFEVAGHAAYDGPDHHRVRLPDNLERFLGAGTPPVVFTLGSAVVNMAGDFYRQGLAAARRCGRRSVLLVGPEGDLGVADGPDSLALPYAPFGALFERTAVIVHQGGVGTTQQALRSGRPQLVVPHLGDQYDNAARVVRLGCALTVKRAEYRAERVSALLQTLLLGEGFKRAADEVRSRIQGEDGARVAARRIVEIVHADASRPAAPVQP